MQALVVLIAMKITLRKRSVGVERRGINREQNVIGQGALGRAASGAG